MLAGSLQWLTHEFLQPTNTALATTTTKMTISYLTQPKIIRDDDRKWKQ